MVKPILFLPCSAAKQQGRQLAKDKYTGSGYWGVARPYLDRFGWNSCHVCIVSAEYGLLRPTDLIQDYERKLTPERVPILLAETKQKHRLRELLKCSDGEIYIACPGLYRELILSLAGTSFASRTVHYFPPGAGIGSQRQILKNWLSLINNDHQQNIQRENIAVISSFKPMIWETVYPGDEIFYRDEQWRVAGPAIVHSICEPANGCYVITLQENNITISGSRILRGQRLLLAS